MTSLTSHLGSARSPSLLAARVARWLAVATFATLAVMATGPTWALVPLLYLAAMTPELSRIDLREHRLPNRLVVPGIAIGLAAWGAESLSVGHVVLTPLVAGGAAAMFLLALCLIGGIGMGDVKLAAALGLASWVPFVGVLAPVVGFLFGGVGSMILIATGRRRGVAAGQRMAFGPYLLAGFWIVVAVVAWARLV